MDRHFGAVSDEILLLIFEEVGIHQSLFNLCLVSRQFCYVATSIMYRHVCIPAHNVRTLTIPPEPCPEYSFQSNLMAHTRHVTVEWALSWKVFAELISKMNHLETLSWSYWAEGFPIEVRQVLIDRWPNAKVHIEALLMRREENSDQSIRQTLNSLFGCQNIHSIDASIDPNFPGPMPLLKEIILGCEMLEVLRLRLPRDDDGYLPHSSTPSTEFDLCVEPGDKLPPLKMLALDSRVTHDNNTISLIPKSFWNWSQIRQLELRGQGMILFLSSIQGDITYLETLVLEHFCSMFWYGGEAERVIEDFIVSIRGLQNLKLTNRTRQIPISTLALHGDTLEKLAILHPRQAISPGLDSAARPYRPEQLDQLNGSCPKLASLALDMEVWTELPYDFLAAVARFPKLKRLRIHFRFQGLLMYPNDNPLLPHLDTDALTVRHMYSYIRSRRLGSPFTLNVIIGHYPRVDPYIQRPRNLFSRPIVQFTCFDDENGNIVLQHDAIEHSYRPWNDYFEARPNENPGVTYPSNLKELLAAEEEADRVMQGLGAVASKIDVDDLFESPR